MAARLDVAKDYLVSIAERTVGLEAPRLLEENLRANSSPEVLKERRVVRSILAATTWAYSLFLPATENVFTHPFNFKPEPSRENLYTFIRKVGPAALYDAGLMVADIILFPHDPIESFILKRMAANAITHTAMDFVGSHVNGISNFRPTATTLAV